MTTDELAKQTDYRRRAVEVAIHVGLVILLMTACLMILRPFLPLVAWGIIIAIAVNPAYQKLRSLLGGRGKLAAVLFTLIFLGVLSLPVALLTETMIQGIQTLIVHTREGTLGIPAPLESVRNWPLVGGPLYSTWDKASTNLTGVLQSAAPQLKALVPGLLHASAGIGMTVLEFVLSILVAGVLLANASSGAVISHSLARRLFGERGPEFETLAGSTIRSVPNGILGVAVIQAVLAGIGFLVYGIARRRVVDLDLSFCDRASDRRARAASRRHLHVCGRKHDESGVVPALVHPGGCPRTRPEASVAGARRCGSDRGDFPREPSAAFWQ